MISKQKSVPLKLEHVSYKPAYNTQGFTIVELMVSLFLALFLTIIAANSYLSSKNTFRSTEQNARMQENIRFASYLINKEIRQAGNLGCFQEIRSHINNPLNNFGQETISALYDISQPVNIWRYNGGGGSGGANGFRLSSGQAYQTPAGNAGRWQDYSPRTFGNGNRRRPGGALLSGRVMNGSDILLVTKISEPLNIRLSAANTRTNNTLQLFPGTTHNLPQGQVLLVGDCTSADLFVHSTVNNNSLDRGNMGPLRVRNRTSTSTNIWSGTWTNNAEVRTLESLLYYIGTGASGLPALFQVNIGQGLGTFGGGAAGFPTPVEVVDGIEIMKLLVGENAVDDPFRSVDSYRRIDQVGSVNAIRNIEVGFLAVGDQNTNVQETTRDANGNLRTYRLTRLHTITARDTDPDDATRDDTRYRKTTLAGGYVRNSGLSRTTKVCMANLDRTCIGGI